MINSEIFQKVLIFSNLAFFRHVNMHRKEEKDSKQSPQCLLNELSGKLIELRNLSHFYQKYEIMRF